ncbi:MAG: hypothetical protein CMM61_17525 [Rhodospirillaceae bacterium]|nr:hypothetical protein [Rhodospirillaceae bacterium]
MARLTTHKSNFTAGEVSTRLLGRSDLRSYANGASLLRNLFIQPTGGVCRRPGTRLVRAAPGDGRLVAFEFNTEQIYLLCFTNERIDVYTDGTRTATIEAPWTEAQLAKLVWVQSADTLLLVHPEAPPRKITRTSDSDWQISDWAYDETDGRIHQPHHKFAATDVTLDPSSTSGTITLVASADVFVDDHVGTRFRLADKEVEITAVASATSATASVKQTLASGAATKDWEEQAFSAVRGWPGSVTFHQDRMVIGGSRDLPNQIWMSKSADLFNFDLGEGLDDEAIEFALLSDQVNACCAVFSGRHLQVFTSGAEWMVTGDPLTPASVQIRRQTRIGSPADRSVPPRNVDGATLFTPRTGRELREFLFTDVEQAYQSRDLATVAEHLVRDPIDQDFDARRRNLHIVMTDGTMASLTIYRGEEITGWTLYDTQGSFRSVCAVGEDIYMLTERANGHFIEIFDDNLNLDCGLSLSDEEAKTQWTGLEHLEGQTVKILADGWVQVDQQVSGGQITLANPASEVVVGLGYAHAVAPLPPAVHGGQGSNQGGRLRLVAATFRLKDASALRLNTGRGFVDVPFREFGGNLLDAPPALYSGDRTVRAFGWRRDGTEPLWRIEQDTPLPFTLLSVVEEVNVNG